MTISHVTELLSPAGSLKNMRYAFAYGADAVYAGQPRYSLRVRNNEFDHENLAIGIQEAHELGKKFYVVVNIQPHNSKLKNFIRDLEPVVAMQPDALIMSDPGLIMMVRENFPDMPVHLSVQANAVNWATVKFWQNMGLTRVILSRELSIDEIEEIKNNVPGMEIEVFVHGALCMAYSGRCMLSGYMNKRDANQGACTNACRWEYKIHDAKEDETGDVIPVKNLSETADADEQHMQAQHQFNEPVLLQRNDEDMFAAEEDEHGTYFMNSKDLRAVQHVDRLTKMGIHSLKIEGRTKSYFYCARTAQIYRKAIDDALAGKPFDPALMTQLEGLANRGYTEGFLRRHVHSEYQNYETGSSSFDHQQFCGEVLERNGDYIKIDVKNRFVVGDSLELMTPQGNIYFTLTEIKDKKGNLIEDAKGSGHIVEIPIPADVDMRYALLIRNLPNSTADISASSLAYQAN
ncbi:MULTISPECIES: tRNA 5-hydroxyuridine modification protein YegQ [Acinetobacter]|jgi:putative protease|uniref:prephenate-dependent tRNA uridine(34) hydroxylase TrhP n=1 Tax=Acinetobacter TaxID=469 RepID=UPI0010400E4F|nr:MULTISPECIES: tRNA 5-hydroxyuridine modification protein YegQ [Acinetobacter]MBT0887233.1 tRNA 5-hydroxyuridine modification protein YegQ [Acinetobacter towneri]MCO8053827.1 tRNA 5-hydroxyuridine modification protein YegQ [Acinetobacter towneri]MCO8055731.1 tRNA 5-hydroxyuridine modification protein YegQ [Acinetobacter towneri]MDD4852757.1 tRNA 5-hydroxyuridine modification protein YegQ [Acinetobacter towneri]MDM1720480.1 tRNA 5-hydroxyuridine modification protein YegQ [Acinetobacter towner